MKNISNNWSLEDYSYINFAPDKYYDEENRLWQGCPTVAVTRKGRLFAGWYSGGVLEPCINNYNIIVMSDDAGDSWSSPILAVESDREKRLRMIDVELWVNRDNSLWMMWTTSPYSENSPLSTIKTPFNFDYHREFLDTMVMICKDPDADVLVWEEPRIMCRGFMRNKPIVTLSGRIIAPGYNYGGDKYMLSCSDDGGKSFHVVTADGKPDINTFDEISICERRPNELRFLSRTQRGFYAYSDSFDGGNTWTVACEYEKAPSTRCYFGKLKSGIIAYVRNVSDAERRGMKICLSINGGDTFPYEMIIDDRENISYPDLDEDENGNIYIVYDRERNNSIKLDKKRWISAAAKEILVCKITSDDVMQNRLAEHSFVRKVISKARIDTVEV